MKSRTLSRRLVALRRRQPVAPAPEPEIARTTGDVLALAQNYLNVGVGAHHNDGEFHLRISRVRGLLDDNGYRRVSQIPEADATRMYRLIQELPR